MVRVARPGRTVDFKQWTFTPALSQDLTGAQTFLATGSVAFGIPGTILRVRGQLRATLGTSGLTALDACNIVLGLALLSTDAVDAGVGSVPDPAAEGEYPWLWYEQMMFRSSGGSALEVGATIVMTLDTKAMRKFKPGESLTLVGQYVNTAGNPLVHFDAGRMRVLIGT